jgi:hypothetical protein
MFKKVFLVLVFVISSLFLKVSATPCFGEGSYFQIRSLKEVYKYLSKSENGDIDPRQLVLFDIDGTLVEYKSKILRKGVNELIIELEKQYKDIDFTCLMSIILNEASENLLEKETPVLIKDLQNRKIMTLALTGCRTGHFGVIESMEKLRFDLLSKFGINFDFFDRVEGHKFSELNSFLEMNDANREYPIFYKGILFVGKGGGRCSVNVNNLSKGQLLVSFLNKLKEENYITTYPNQIILIDDRRCYLDSLKEECGKLNIPFIGLHFVRDEAADTDLDLIKEKESIETLINEKKWVDVMSE